MRASWERRWTLFAAVVIAVVSSVAMPAAVHAAQLGYTGGPVIVNPHIYIDYWGPEWGSTTPDSYGYTPAQAKNYVQSFLQNIGGSYSLGVLSQYYQWPIGGVQTFITNPTGQFNPATDIYADTRPVPSPFYRSDITLEAAAYADAHFQAHTDFDRVYLILTGPGKTPQDLTQPPDTQDCAYHDWTQSNGHRIAFAYVPWWQSTPATCFMKSVNPVDDSFGHGLFDAFSKLIVHEYAEAITDPEPGQSWSVPGTDTNPQEIGDECNTDLGNTWLGSQYYAMQGLWANGIGSCFLAKGDTPSPYPTCSTPTLTASPPSAQVAGANVTFTGATSVCPSPSYRFWVRPPGGAWSVVQDYGPNWNFVWKAGAATGTYNIEVDVRDQTSTASYEAYTTISYVVQSASPGGAAPSESATFRGHFTGGGTDSVAALYDYGGGEAKLWVWQTGFAGPQLWWDSGPGNFYASNAKVVTGDFNGDGKTDIAFLYNYPNCPLHVAWLVMPSTGTSFTNYDSNHPWWDSGCNNFDWNKAKVSAGNFTGGLKTDVAVLYDYSAQCPASTSWLVFPSTGTTFTGFYHWWDSGCNNFWWSSAKVVAGDFEGNGRADVAVLYNYTNCSANSSWLVFHSTGSSFSGFSHWWDSGCNGFYWSSAKIVAGDFNGDGKTDVAVLYNYTSCSASSSWLVFTSSGTSFPTFSHWWDSGCNNFNWNNSQVVAGNFSGGSKFDVAVFYDYSGNCALKSDWLWFKSNGGSFPAWQTAWDSGCGNWDWSRTTPI